MLCVVVVGIVDCDVVYKHGGTDWYMLCTDWCRVVQTGTCWNRLIEVGVDLSR